MLYTMKEILTDAQEKGYGVGYFNAVNMEMVRAYICAAEQCQSPIIIGTAEALMPYADFQLDRAHHARAGPPGQGPRRRPSGPHIQL